MTYTSYSIQRDPSGADFVETAEVTVSDDVVPELYLEKTRKKWPSLIQLFFTNPADGVERCMTVWPQNTSNRMQATFEAGGKYRIRAYCGQDAGALVTIIT